MLYAGGMAANYNRPKPIDPIWYRHGCYLRIHCACGRQLSEPLGAFARARGVSFNTQAHELIARLRCTNCGRRPWAEVTRYRSGN